MRKRKAFGTNNASKCIYCLNWSKTHCCIINDFDTKSPLTNQKCKLSMADFSRRRGMFSVDNCLCRLVVYTEHDFQLILGFKLS